MPVGDAQKAVDVRTLGEFAIHVRGVPVHRRMGAGGRALAAFLFVHPDVAHRRERLMDLFWQDLDEACARRAMNTAIWRLRRIVAGGSRDGENLLHVDGSEVRWVADGRVHVDSQALTACVPALWERARRGDSQLLADSERTVLQAALKLYRGPFLDGLDDDWVLQARERLHTVYVRGLILLMAEAATVGDYEAALDAARAVLAVDPLRETVQRHTMRLLVLNGQRAEAIRQYNRCRALLSEECDVAPMPQTQAVYQSIVSGEIFNSLAVARSRVAAAPRPRDAAMPV